MLKSILGTPALLLVLLAGPLGAQPESTQDYIDRWASTAQEEMKLYGIPASITLAQGILESGSGKSYLAREANNHFGIKCHLDWEGKKVYRDDDKKDECFRSYRDAQKSFRDHSLFLAQRSRYKGLFAEDPKDYKAWARGLRKAGYATDRKYHKRLIDLIERYELDQYDEISPERSVAAAEEAAQKEEKSSGWGLFSSSEPAIPVEETSNRVDYVVAQEGDTFESLAIDTDKRPRDLLKYNELRYDAQLKTGQRVFIQPKRNKATRDNPYHVAEDGQSMYDISQLYGVKLRKLYKHNDMAIGTQPEIDELIHLR